MNSDELVFKKRSSTKPRVISVRLEEDVLRGIDDAVRESGHSRNELINEMLKYAVSHVVVEP